MGNLIVYKTDHSQGSYLKVSTEFLFSTLSPEAKGVFVTLMNLTKDWQLTESGMAKIMHTTTYKIRKIFKELKTAGYLDFKMIQDKTGKFEEKMYVLKEVLDTPTEENFSSLPTSRPKSSRMDSHRVEIQSDGSQSDGFYGQINNLYNNNLYNYNLFKNNNLYNNTKSKDFETKAFSSLENKNRSMDHDLERSSKDLKTKTNDAALDKNHDISSIMKVTDPKNEVPQKPKRRSNKNLVQQMEEEKGDSVVKVDSFVEHKMNQITAQENEISRVTKVVNELLAMDKAVNKSNMLKLTNIKQMQKEADRLIPDIEVAKWFKDFLEVKIQKSGHMGKPTVALLYEDLKCKACEDRQTMIILLKEAIRLGWNDFYVSDSVQKQVESLKQVQQLNTSKGPVEEEEYVEVLDADGNPISF